MKRLLLIVALAVCAVAAAQTPTYLGCTGAGASRVCSLPSGSKLQFPDNSQQTTAGAAPAYADKGYINALNPLYTGDFCQKLNTGLIAEQGLGFTTYKADMSGATGAQTCSINFLKNVTLQGGELVLPSATITTTKQWGVPSKFTVRGSGELGGTSSNTLILADPAFVFQQQPTASSNDGTYATITVPSTASMDAGTVLVLEGTGTDLDTALKVNSVVDVTHVKVAYTGSSTVGASRVLPIASITGLCGNFYASGNSTNNVPYPFWTSGNAYALGNLIIPKSLANGGTGNAGGYIYKVTTAGTSGGSEPATWNQAVGGTVSDGTAVFTNLGQPCSATMVLGATTTATSTSGSNVLAVTSASNISAGETVSMTGVPNGTTVVSVSSLNVTISANATASGTVTAAFGSNHGLLTGGVPVTVAGTSTALDGTQYVISSTIPASNLYSLSFAYLGSPISTGALGTVTVAPLLSEPLVVLGTGVTANGADLGCRLDNLGVDANDRPGSIGIFSTTANEHCGPGSIMVKNTTRRGIWFTKTSNGALANAALDGHGTSQIYGSATNAPANDASYQNSKPWVGIDIYAGGGALEKFAGWTIRPSANRNPLADGIHLGALTGTLITGIHCEIERDCVDMLNRGSSAQQSSGLAFYGITGGFGGFGPGGAGLFNSLIRVQSSGATSVNFAALQKGGGAYIVDDSMGGNSFAGGSAITDASCTEYLLFNSNSVPACSSYTHEFYWPSTMVSHKWYIRDGTNTFRSMWALDSLNNPALTSNTGLLGVYPNAGSSTTNKTWGLDFTAAGICLYPNSSSFCATINPAAVTAARTLALQDLGGTVPVQDAAHTTGYASYAPDGRLTSTSAAMPPLSVQSGLTDTVNCPANTTANFATTYTIPANTITTGSLLRLTMSFTLATTATVPNLSFRLNIGGTTVFQAANTTVTATTIPEGVSITFLISGTASPSASSKVIVNPLLPSTNQNAVYTPFAQGGSVSNSPNLATNGTLVIQPVFFCSAATAGNSMTLNSLSLEPLF